MTLNCSNDVPFSVGDWIIDKNNPGQPGQFTGQWSKAGPHTMVQLLYPDGSTSNRPIAYLEPMAKSAVSTIKDRLKAGHFGKLRDLQRLITFEKLKGTLHEVIYSMEAAQIDFYPYQFKPVLKFINSPTERLIIADEVGLGKTIESALIWMELQARRQAKRLLVVCPKILAEKWRDELRTKFLFDARVVDFSTLDQELSELESSGPGHSFVLIGTYSGLRPPKKELRLLREPLDINSEGSSKTNFLQKVRHWSLDYDPFDLVIFDEAHYMRNPATTTFHLGESLAANAGAVLCVSATPVNNSNVDLHSLLRLIDGNFFESQGLFEELLKANRPAVQAINALASTPVNTAMLSEAVTGMGESNYISKSPLFRQFLEQLEKLNLSDHAQLAKCQDIAEKLNLLGGYVNRTRRVQVKENRPLRDPVVQTIEYTPEEAQLYKSILHIVRRKCQRDSRPFHVFQILGLQLRAASCLPSLVQDIRNGRFGDPGDLLSEAVGEEVIENFLDDDFQEELGTLNFDDLLEYDFEKNDSKYHKLKDLLLNVVPTEKAVLFAYYRPTLAYLQRRLSADGVKVAVIHGGIANDQRWVEIERFKDPNGPRILLSSEVGSEGIDLQFSRVLINYDLPWNPMRVEQRIGRIDRVGQQAKRLSIVNFKVLNTIEERLYDRLHSKLARFSNSLGDLEAVIGNEVQHLTVELLSKDLSPEEEIQLMEQSERVIEDRLLQIQALEESGEALIALSDYVQKKIEEDKGKGRYLQSEELEDYLIDFFEREFRGCELNQNTPANGCLKVRLTNEAQASLANFVQDDRSLSARPFRQREFSITFRREVLQKIPSNQKHSIHFTNHLSPLVRWITQINRERAHSFFDVSALKSTYSELPAGVYCYRIERWRFVGLASRERLAYGIRPLNVGMNVSEDLSESVVQNLLRNSMDWDYVECKVDDLINAHSQLEEEMSNRFSAAVENFADENETTHQIKAQRVIGVFDRRIMQDKQRLQTSMAAGRGENAIRLAEGRLKAAISNKDSRLKELNTKAQIDVEQASVAAGIFRIDS